MACFPSLVRTEYKNQEVMIQLYTNFGLASFQAPHAVVVVFNRKEGYGDFREGAVEVYQNYAWIRRY